MVLQTTHIFIHLSSTQCEIKGKQAVFIQIAGLTWVAGFIDGTDESNLHRWIEKHYVFFTKPKPKTYTEILVVFLLQKLHRAEI